VSAGAPRGEPSAGVSLAPYGARGFGPSSRSRRAGVLSAGTARRVAGRSISSGCPARRRREHAAALVADYHVDVSPTCTLASVAALRASPRSSGRAHPAPDPSTTWLPYGSGTVFLLPRRPPIRHTRPLETPAGSHVISPAERSPRCPRIWVTVR